MKGLWSPSNIMIFIKKEKDATSIFSAVPKYIPLNMFLETKCLLILCDVNKKCTIYAQVRSFSFHRDTHDRGLVAAGLRRNSSP